MYAHTPQPYTTASLPRLLRGADRHNDPNTRATTLCAALQHPTVSRGHATNTAITHSERGDSVREEISRESGPGQFPARQARSVRDGRPRRPGGYPGEATTDAVCN